MKLRALSYVSPELTEGKFDEVFVEEKKFTIEKGRSYMSIEFEMYYMRNGVKIELDTRAIAFYGMAGESVTSNKLAVISVPDEEYDSKVAAVSTTMLESNPLYDPEPTVTQTNPDYDPNNPESSIFITVSNPDYNTEEFITVDNIYYAQQVAAISHTKHVPLLEYLYANQGQLPADYQVVQWGYPNFEDALKYFNGGDRNNPDITVTNPFAKEWIKNNIVMKGEILGTQFNFED